MQDYLKNDVARHGDDRRFAEYKDSPDRGNDAGLLDDIDLTLIVPCHNEQDNVQLFYQTAEKTFDDAGVRLEIVFINDGSSDHTLERLRQIVDDARGTHVVQVIGFSRNFGKESGVYAGLQHARGRFMCIIDADMQQDPFVALKMYRFLQNHPEYDEVAAYQAHRHESPMMRWLKERFYATFNSMTKEIQLTPDASDFRVFKCEVGEAILQMPEYFRFSKGLFSWVGFNVYTMPYDAKVRHSGTSNWSYRSLFHYASEGIMAFTTWPLKIVKYIGFVTAILALIYLLYSIIVDYFILHNGVAGYPTLVCLILLFGGVQTMVLGIIGDYLARDYVEGKHRPIYLMKQHYDTLEQLDGEDRRSSPHRPVRPPHGTNENRNVR